MQTVLTAVPVFVWLCLCLQVEFSPTPGQLAQIVNIMPQLINTISEFKRLPELLSCKQSEGNPIHINIGYNYLKNKYVLSLLFYYIFQERIPVCTSNLFLGPLGLNPDIQWDTVIIKQLYIKVYLMLVFICLCLYTIDTLVLNDPPEQDEKIRKIQAAVTMGMTANASHLQAYLKTWDKYRDIWEINKDSFIQRYQRLNPPVTSFDADIHR